MFKIIGGAFIVIASFLFGLNMKRELKNACVFTEDLASGLYAVKEEIRYTSDYLQSNILRSADVSGTARPFFDVVYRQMSSGDTAEEAWGKASSVIPDMEARVLISEIGRQIGKTDAEGQMKMLDNCIEKLKILAERQKEKFERQGGMFPKFGAVIGVLITILLI